MSLAAFRGESRHNNRICIINLTVYIRRVYNKLTMSVNINNRGIFGTFRLLTPAQIMSNAKFVANWVVGYSIAIVGIVIAVRTGIVWIAPVFAIVGFFPLIFALRVRKNRYTPRFGKKYNMLRGVICGFLIYGDVGWRGLLGFYNYLRWKQGWDISISSYGWTILALSLSIALIFNLSLYRIVDVKVADLAGIIEMAAAGIFIGSIMFLILYA